MKLWRAIKRLGIGMASLVDAGDVLYASGVVLVSVGAWWFHPGAAFICAGLGTTFPFVVAMLRGSPKGKP